jgi:hypothetical protein
MRVGREACDSAVVFAGGGVVFRDAEVVPRLEAHLERGVVDEEGGLWAVGIGCRLLIGSGVDCEGRGLRCR